MVPTEQTEAPERFGDAGCLARGPEPLRQGWERGPSATLEAREQTRPLEMRPAWDPALLNRTCKTGA